MTKHRNLNLYNNRKLDYLYGLRPVLSALKSDARKIDALYLLKDYEKDAPEHITKTKQFAENRNIPIKYHTKVNHIKYK